MPQSALAPMSVVLFVSGGGLQITGISTTLWAHVSREKTLLFVSVFLSVQCNVLCSVYAEMLNRCQDQLQLTIFDVDCFVTVEDSTDAVMQDADDSMSVPGSAWIIREEMSKYWVNVSILMQSRSGIIHLPTLTDCCSHRPTRYIL